MAASHIIDADRFAIFTTVAPYLATHAGLRVVISLGSLGTPFAELPGIMVVSRGRRSKQGKVALSFHELREYQVLKQQFRQYVADLARQKAQERTILARIRQQ